MRGLADAEALTPSSSAGPLIIAITTSRARTFSDPSPANIRVEVPSTATSGRSWSALLFGCGILL